MSITEETRRQSFEEIKPKISPRHRLCIFALDELGQATANEVAKWLYVKGHTPFFNRNFVHPRLNELIKSKYVEVVGKRVDPITGKTCAVYQLIKGGGKSVFNALYKRRNIRNCRYYFIFLVFIIFL